VRFLRRRRGAYAWTGILVLLLPLLSSTTLALGHSAHAGANAGSQPAADTRSHDHCADGADSGPAGQGAAAPGHCPHCADRACCLLGCAPATLEFSTLPLPRDAAEDSCQLSLLTPAFCAESLYRPPITL